MARFGLESHQANGVSAPEGNGLSWLSIEERRPSGGELELASDLRPDERDLRKYMGAWDLMQDLKSQWQKASPDSMDSAEKQRFAKMARETVTASDTEFQQTWRKSNSEYEKIGPRLESMKHELLYTVELARPKIAQLPEADRAKVAEQLNDTRILRNLSDPKFDFLHKLLSNYPSLKDIDLRLQNAWADRSMDRNSEEALRRQISTAANGSTESRRVAGEVLEKCGFADEAKKVQDEGMRMSSAVNADVGVELKQMKAAWSIE